MRAAPIAFLVPTLLFLLGIGGCPPGTEIELPGLSEPVKVTTDHNGVWHIQAENDFDIALAQGYVHCRDRLFQMDQTRRQVDGTEAELLGPGRLNADIQAQVIGLHRAAQRSFDAAPPRFQALLTSYADGVNHCIDTLPLPPEYALLELTQVRPWEPVDPLKIGKAITASLSLDIDTGLTQSLLAFIGAGIANGFDGQALFSEDVFRSAPLDPAVIGAEHGLVHATDDRLREIDFGVWEGLTGSQIRERFPQEWAAIMDGNDLPRGGTGDTWGDVVERMWEASMAIAGGGGRTAAVSHGGSIQALATKALGLEYSERGLLTLPDNVSSTSLAVHDDHVELLDFNAVGHLEV